MRIQKILLALGMTGLLLGEAGSGHPPAARAQAVQPAGDEAWPAISGDHAGATEGESGDEELPKYRSGAEDRETISITVYNQNFGLVREVREIDLASGLLNLEFADVASSIQTETVHIRSLTRGRPLKVLEQNYRYDLLNPQKLLEKYVGRTVTVYRWNAESCGSTSRRACNSSPLRLSQRRNGGRLLGGGRRVRI